MLKITSVLLPSSEFMQNINIPKCIQVRKIKETRTKIISRTFHKETNRFYARLRRRYQLHNLDIQSSNSKII